MPTPTVPSAALDLWLSATAIGQPGVSASSTPETTAPPAAPAGGGGAQPGPVIPGMPQDAASNPGTASTTSTTGQPGTGTAPAGRAPGNDMFMFVIWGGMILLIVMIFSSSRQAKREKKKRDELISSLRRNDKVQTIGGMIGTVVELRDDEVVIQGENPGSKFRFSRTAIQQVLRSSGSSDGSAGTTPEVEVKAGKEGSKV